MHLSLIARVPIPDLVGTTIPYWLPPGTHDCSRVEVEDRFVYNAERRKVWRYFVFFVERMRDLGGDLDNIIVDGSFVTGRKEPGDVDACCLLEPPKLRAMLNGSPDADALMFFLSKPHEAKRLFGVHVFAHASQQDFDRFVKFFGEGQQPHGLRDPDPQKDPPGVTKPAAKGLLRVSLANFFGGATT